MSKRNMIFKKKLVAHALVFAFGASVLTIGVMPEAMAQSSNGAVNGQAPAGAVVTIENKSIGLMRSVKAGKDGTFTVSQLPPGTYTLKSGNEELNVVVNAGEGSAATFMGSAQQVVVSARVTRIDVKSPESNLVMNKAAIDRVPVLRDVTAVALLAPGAVAGDSRIGQTGSRAGNVPSLGGASPAENVYYINGFNVTNNLNGVAFNQVPFDAIGQQQVKTGGYGAEFGRSLGGVLSVTTKRGTNEWHGGANVVYSPESLEASSVYTEKSAVTGKWELHNRPGGTNDLKSNVWLGGPIIKDKLFIFGLIQAANIKRESYFNTEQETLKNTTPQYLMKVDWNINDSNLLEFTGFSDKSKDEIGTYKAVTPYGGAKGALVGNDSLTNGGQNLIGKYTTWVNDDLTVSAMYGVGKYDRKSEYETASCAYITDARTSPSKKLGCATTTRISDPNANDKRTAFRIDAEWNLGAHSLRFGMDDEKYEVVDGSRYPGGENYSVRNLNPGAKLSNGYVNNTGAVQPYMVVRHFENGGVFTTKNSAFYIEDNWQATKNVVANIGLRSESFNNLNADGVDFINVKNTIAPRLGLVWDVKGNAETKVFANAGRYYIPVMSNTNVRLAGAELDYTDYYAFNGTFSADKFSMPGRGAQLGSRLEVSNGKAADPRTVVDPNIKPMYQDEFILGLQQAFGNRWSGSVKVTHRKLQSVMDDMCNDEGAGAWAAANGYNAADAATIAGTVGHCFLYNPGKDLTANVAFASGMKAITIPAAALMFPKPVRTFNALEFGFDRAWDGKWSLQGNYVLAFNKGNTEGYVKSDIGQDDAGISQDWDYPGLAEGSNGYLPNDRRHTLKVWGSYQVTPEFRLGANLVVQSGRPRNCLGYYDGTLDGVSIYYGAASFYCTAIKPGLQPRGSYGRTDWTRDLSLQAHYAPSWYKGLTFAVDVLNVFNERTVKSINEQGESSLGTISPNYQQPLSIQKARTVRLTAQYEF